MQLCLINHQFRYEIEKLIRLFLPFEKIEFFNTIMQSDSCLVTEFCNNKAKSTLYLGQKTYTFEREILQFDQDLSKNQELTLALTVYDCFTTATGYFPDWGILTGVRPAKLFSRLKNAHGEDTTCDYFSNFLKVSPKKLELCRETLNGEGEITSLSCNDSFSLYISIPFCPTRCSYCSFVSHSIEQAQKLMPEYVKKLCEELKATSFYVKKYNLKLESIYIGGGTPTTLDAQSLKIVLECIKSNFDFTNLREYTVEAGRPDTITEEKLLVIKNYGVTRISINPQTLNDSVLSVIGRNHSAKQFEDAFFLARKCGFDNINTDLISGLPTDTFESFKNTIDRIISLSPESVTVHSLSMKRSSNLTLKSQFPEIEVGKIAAKMVDYAYNTLKTNQIFPYYMYRQSKTVGNLENVGYSKKGYECLYNVFIMDETHTILSCGASAVTKLREPGGELIERIFNYKYPYEYINDFSEMLKRKKRIDEFYSIYKI